MAQASDCGTNREDEKRNVNQANGDPEPDGRASWQLTRQMERTKSAAKENKRSPELLAPIYLRASRSQPQFTE